MITRRRAKRIASHLIVSTSLAAHHQPPTPNTSFITTTIRSNFFNTAFDCRVCWRRLRFCSRPPLARLSLPSLRTSQGLQHVVDSASRLQHDSALAHTSVCFCWRGSSQACSDVGNASDCGGCTRALFIQYKSQGCSQSLGGRVPCNESLQGGFGECSPCM